MATKKIKGLGRGLEALLGPTASESGQMASAVGAPTVLKLDELIAGVYQPRKRMDEGALYELAESIKSQGIMQPILVRKIEAGGYEIIAGERRFRAAKLAGLTEVPVLVREVTRHLFDVRGLDAMALHDPLTVAVALQPDLVTTTQADVEVETTGTHTLGQTVVDLRPSAPPPVRNTRVCTDVDVARFRKLFFDTLT